MKINKIAVAFLSLCMFGLGAAAAIEVNEPELRSVGRTVEFTNYTGPHSVIETADAITEIGRGLGRQVARNVNTSGTFGLNGKYAVIHAVDPSTKEKLDADIILINPNATVDHIRNLRRIIAGYLTAAYGYSNADATTVATFVTVYNAVYRGNLDVYKSKYKDVVTRNLNAANCGLSTTWSEWPGKSQIVIPLYDLNGGLSTVDTSVISDKNVVDNLRDQDDMGIDDRKKLVDIKEREAEDASEKAEAAAKAAEAERQKLAQQQQDANKAQQDANKAQQDANKAQQDANKAQQDADKAQQDAEKARQDALKAQQDARNNPDDAAKQQAAQKAQQDAAKAQQDADKAQQDADKAKQDANKAQQDAAKAQSLADSEKAKADEQQKKTDEADKKAAAQQEFADQKQEEAQRERTEIAKDQQRLLQDALAVSESNTVIGLKVVDSAKDLSQMIKVNVETGATVRVSPVSLIHRRIILPVANPAVDSGSATRNIKESVQTEAMANDIYYMAICGENANQGAVRLCLLDSDRMEIQKESNELVAEDSVLVNDGSSYYCVIQDGNKWVVGKYDKSLNLQLKSTVAVEQNTPITVSPRAIVVTDSTGTIILLNPKDLSKK